MANDFFRQPAPGLVHRKISKVALVTALVTGAISQAILVTWAQAPSAPAKVKTTQNKAASPNSASPKDAAVKQAPLTEENKHIIRARTMAAEGRFDDSCAELREVLEKNPKSVEALFFLGYVLGRQGKYVNSIAREKDALELSPNNAAAYAVLGLSLGSLHQYSEAAKALQQSIKIQPQPSTFVNLAAIREKQGDNQAACNLYRRAITINPQYSRAYLGLGEALGKMGDKGGQVDACRTAVKYAPKSAMAHAKLGMALSEAGDIGGSVAEGFTANALKVQESWNEFLGTFLAAWGLVFLGFSLIFAVCFAGSRFKPQDGEKVLRSFFLTFYKDQPGRFVVTDSRLVFVPELFSSVFGATRVSIQRAQVESIQYLSTMGGGTVSILTKDKSVHQFRMPILVLDPLRSLLVGQALANLGGPESEPEIQAAATPIDAVGADAEPEKEPPAPTVQTDNGSIPAELEITEVDTEISAAQTAKAEDNKSNS